MGIRVFLDTNATGVGSNSRLGLLSANGQKLTTVIGNVLPGTIASVGNQRTMAGVTGIGFPGVITTSRTRSITGNAATGSVNTLLTGSNATAWGMNIAGMEWAAPGLRYGASSAPNRDFSVPRAELISFIASRGFTRTRLPIQWELIQPVLRSQGAVSTVLNAYGIANSGDLQQSYVRMVKQVLDAHQAAGIKCCIDLHNYCKYQDFIYNPDGTVPGFTILGGVLQPYTSTGSVQVRIFSSGPNPTLSSADYGYVWQKIAQQFMGHPGLGGYMIMNEPNSLDSDNTWPTYAQACINAIRQVDPNTTIYIGGNNWSSTVTIGTRNPGFPLTGTNLVYEGHMYLDASSGGNVFDYDLEVAKGFSLGEAGAINANTGFNRLTYMTNWLASNNQKGAVTECGMPLDDSRWVTMFKGALDLAWSKGLEWYTWMSGDHWSIHSYPINYVPGFYQGQTMEPKVGGVMRQSMGLSLYTLYDSSQSYASGGSVVVTVTLFCRGYVASSFGITLTKTAGTGTLSAGSVTMPSGANPSVTYTYTTVADEIASITYSGPAQVPPPRKIYSLTNPVTYAATSLTDAGRALLAKYSAAEWLSVNGMKDYMGSNAGVVAGSGDYVRAISDSGFASVPANTFEMTNWIRVGADYGTMAPPQKVVATSLHKLDTVGASVNNWGSTLSQHVNPQPNLSKVLAGYFNAQDGSMAFDDTPSIFNVVHLYNCVFAGPNPNTNNNGDGSLTFNFFSSVTATRVQAVRARGQKVILTCGGQNNGYNINTRQQSTNFVNTFNTIVGQLGGVDGIEFNNFSNGVGSSANELIWIVQQLRSRYGQGFIVTAQPAPTATADQALLQTLYQASCLTWAEPQFYDSATWVGNTAGIQTQLSNWVTLFNGDASAVVFNAPANANLDAGPTVTECATVYDAFVAANAACRGAMCWSVQINKASTTTSGSGNVWGLWCKKFDVKESSNGELVQPNGKEVVLFDIHDPHFVVSAVELINSASDGAIFSTNKAEAGSYSELGIASGGMPTAKFNDYNGNSLSLVSSTGLTNGAHVLTMQSTGTAQTLRVDKTQVSSGARTLTANSTIGSNSHLLGWRFFNYFERGTPGCYIYGVIAGKGNPTASELTVIERYLGNTYAGLSL